MLAGVAHAAAPPVGLEQGVALFQRGDFAAAARVLEDARARDPTDTDAGLLLGISYYRLHRLDDAERLLAESAAVTDPDTVASARIFLALIAMERDQPRRARALLDGTPGPAARELAAGARDLLEGAPRPALTVFAMIRPEYDSNVPLIPTAPVTPSPAQADADLLLLGSLAFRPAPAIPLRLEASVSYRKQFQITDFDFFDATAAVRYDDGALSAALDAQAMTLGNSAYAEGGSAQIGYRLRLGGSVTPWARYLLRYRNYDPDAYAGYTGFSHAGAAGVEFGAPQAPLTADVDYILLREATSADDLTATGQGVNGALTWRARRFSVVASGTVIWRSFDAGRSDVQGLVDLSLAVDVTRSFGLVAGWSLLRNGSTLADADYLKITAFAGVYLGASP